MTTIYIAEFKWREYRIVSVEVIKETPKQYQIDKSTIKGYPKVLYLPKGVNKNDYPIFATLVEAKRWCLMQLRIHMDGLEAQMSQAQSMIATLEAEIGEVQP